MSVIFILLPLSLILAGAGIAAYTWCVSSQQFEDPDGDSLKPLFDERDSRGRSGAP